MRFVVLTVLIFTSIVTSSAQRKKFTPIYGSDSEINHTLAFITENITFDSITYSRLNTVNGFIRCTFSVDTDGSIVDVKIARSLAYWLDHEVLVAMKTLPKMDPFTNKNGEPIRVRRDVYFTFNNPDDRRNTLPPTYEDHMPVSAELARQQKKEWDKNIANEKSWNKFTADNTKISLDGKSIYKPGVLPNNPLKIKTPPIKPPVTITIQSE